MIWIGEMYQEARNEAKQHENMKICLQDDNERLRAQLAAARNDALEEAAKIVDDFKDEFSDHHSKAFAQGAKTQAIGCAAAIRAIKQEGQ